MARKSPIQRFFDLCVPLSCGCWIWIGALRDERKQGYGSFWVNGKNEMAHRWSYRHHRGVIPRNKVLDHTCKTPSCVNPAHLEVVMQVENIRRGDTWKTNGLKTHCPQGHEYSEANTFIERLQSGGNGRRCRTCKNERRRVAVKED